ncbi:phage portal protein [Catenuloplanes nepalensis]|nr:phage portal protein [Catenuloplanes nepalensis]
MPTGGAWPPPQLAPAYQAYRDWDAWYDGSPDKLTAVYNGRAVTGQTLPPSQRLYPGQRAGGLVGRVSRWLWGSPPPSDARDGRLHVPLPADLTAAAANLLFSETPRLTAEDTAVQARLDQLIEDGLTTTLLHAAEADSALGDVYLRPVVDQEVSPGKAFLAAVHADGAVPTIRWGRLLEVTFWSVLEVDGNTWVRLLEHHSRGRIEYALFIGTATDLGQRRAFADHPGAAYLADLVDDSSGQSTGLDRLDVVRIPNAGPQRRWRTLPALKYLGRSDLDGSEQIFDRIDDVWTSWMRDIHLARARIMVPDYMLTSNGPGAGSSFDADREVFRALRMPPNSESAGGQITVAQFAIRHAEHKATGDALVELALRHAGLSSQTLGDEGDVAVTATEVQARERQSFTTRGTRVQSWAPAIAEAVELLLAVERVQLGGRADPVRPNVEFGDSVSESPETIARTLQLLQAAEAVSLDTKVRMLHPDWADPDVRAEVERIKQDSGTGADPEQVLAGFAGNTSQDGDVPGEGENEEPAEE